MILPRTPKAHRLARRVAEWQDHEGGSRCGTGRRRLDQLDRLLAGVQDQLLAPLSPAERTQLVALLTRLVEHHAGG